MYVYLLQAIMKHMVKSCQCHGISGSCTWQTCYKRMPLLDRVQPYLRRKYEKAVRVMGDQTTNSLKVISRRGASRGRHKRRRKARASRMSSKSRWVKRNSRNNRRGEQLLPDDLFYVTPSLNFCKTNRRYGTVGTRGRKCDNTHKRRGSCARLCCGRGHRTIRKSLIENCNCRFVEAKGSMDVVCDRCTKNITTHTCR